MRNKTPSTIKEWVREVKSALAEAASILDENMNTESEVNEVDMFKMAPAIAAIYRSIESEEIKCGMIEALWSIVLYVHENIPGYKKSIVGILSMRISIQ